MCERQEVSKEHVPPKCLFPQIKDIDCDSNFRANLITVPSCDEHNSKKSGDDEFLMYVLVSELMASGVVAPYMVKKLKRAIDRNPTLAQKIFSNAKDVSLKSKDGYVDSLEVPLDSLRLNSCFDHIARGLYYHETGFSWLSDVQVIPDFVYFIEGEDAHEIQGVHVELGVLAKMLLHPLDPHGENSDVFSYKFLKCDESPFASVAQIEFYKNCVVTILYVYKGAKKC
ncbi:hypothetical protein [Pseudoalteromonas sp. S3431]|uniref:hypothetical protein n=1 Tax=Pseudoalteromonas sp. S3431 TaxID=579537 RepID=UPI0004A15ABE|nr:hypothetical protein [Pseudoalteromonas sp. S3431]KDC49682.1 hypothetical protein DO88_18835 [Pseudoalteromonas sp. S3431]